MTEEEAEEVEEEEEVEEVEEEVWTCQIPTWRGATETA